MITAITPEKKVPKTLPTTVPITAISIASTSLAFLPPTTTLPESHIAGAIKIVENITFNTNASRLSDSLITIFHFFNSEYYSTILLIKECEDGAHVINQLAKCK